MSSTTEAAPEAGMEELVAVVEEKPGRKFPAPCWTQEETLALIEAYRERWYALRRGYLRTADWDSVAETVVSRCPDASPAKTSAQCRHKMEKLRQRYRAEKQRSLSYPAGRFFSNWFFFENMDAMENGTVVSAARSNQEPDKQTISGNAFGLKTLIDQNILKLKLNPTKLTKSIEDSNPNFGFDQEITPKNFGARVPNGYLSYLDVAASKKEQVDVLHLETPFGMKTRIDGIPIPIGFKPKRSSFNGELKNGFDVVNKEMGKLDRGMNSNLSEYNGINPSEEYIMRVLADRNSSVHVRGNNGGGAMEDSNHDMGVSSNRFLSSSLPRVGKKMSDGSSGVGCKRERNSVDSVDQIAASIRFLGEGFMKIEKMKMEMAKEIEQMRMEREMKQSQMILESQKQMVDCFMKVLSELKNSKKAKKAGEHEQES